MELEHVIGAKMAQQSDQNAIWLPWWIIDPTGEVITAQRHELSARESIFDESRKDAEKKTLQASQEKERIKALTRRALAMKQRTDEAKQRRNLQLQMHLEKRRAMRAAALRAVEHPRPWYAPSATFKHKYLPTLYPGWDMLTMVALVFTALVTPFEIGFLPPNVVEQTDHPLWCINRVIDVSAQP